MYCLVGLVFIDHTCTEIATVKSKSIKMNLRIVAADVSAIRHALRQIANGRLSSNECVIISGVAEYDYDFVHSEDVFSQDGNKKVIDPNETHENREKMLRGKPDV